MLVIRPSVSLEDATGEEGVIDASPKISGPRQGRATPAGRECLFVITEGKPSLIKLSGDLWVTLRVHNSIHCGTDLFLVDVAAFDQPSGAFLTRQQLMNAEAGGTRPFTLGFETVSCRNRIGNAAGRLGVRSVGPRRI